MSSSGLTRGSLYGILDGILNGILDGILNEIAPSALLPCNDGIFEFSVMSSPQGGWGMTEREIPKKGILKFLGILVEFKLKNSKILKNSR